MEGGHRDAVVFYTSFVHSKMGGLETSQLCVTTLWALCPKRAASYQLTHCYFVLNPGETALWINAFPHISTSPLLSQLRLQRNQIPVALSLQGQINESEDSSHFFNVNPTAFGSQGLFQPIGRFHLYRILRRGLSQRTSSGFTPN